jgi:hypothetical protein
LRQLLKLARTTKRRRFQYSLRTLLVFVTLCALACSWLAVKMRRAERQRAAATAVLEKLERGGVHWDERASQWPRWLRRVLGDDFFNSVVEVDLHETGVSDAELEHLEGLDQLQTLRLYGTNVSDAGLEHLKGLNQLQTLELYDTNVGDAGLEHLKGLSRLQLLALTHTKVTDAGLEHLKGLSQLRTLALSQTEVMEHLKGLAQLQALHLSSTEVTNEGVQRLQQSLPNCKIEHEYPRQRAMQ